MRSHQCADIGKYCLASNGTQWFQLIMKQWSSLVPIPTHPFDCFVDQHLPKWAPAWFNFSESYVSTYPHLPLSPNNGAGCSLKTYPNFSSKCFLPCLVKHPQKTLIKFFGFGVCHKQTHSWAGTGAELLHCFTITGMVAMFVVAARKKKKRGRKW